ncbi:MAG: ligase-associated DNA damage response endonuclease PdeM [Gemmatimonadaceae bacterium]|nr:ligase-associated DNA damage response endonuclease PdeM [Gemmatimonadaceae bacterium]
MSSASLTITVADVSVQLRPERAIYIPSLQTLVVADLHWGKAAAFRAAHVPVPTGTTASDLARLSSALHSTGAERLIVLGDLLHAKHGRHPDTLATIHQWRQAHTSLAIDVVRGNHDHHAGDAPSTFNIRASDAPLRFGPFVGYHEPTPHATGYVLSGHLHPHVTLRGRGRQSLTLPCFILGPTIGILPAFTEFTGHGAYTPTPSDQVYAIAGDQVIATQQRA